MARALYTHAFLTFARESTEQQWSLRIKIVYGVVTIIKLGGMVGKKVQSRGSVARYENRRHVSERNLKN